jgi:transposase
MWAGTASLRSPGGDPFYERIHRLLDTDRFDGFAGETPCKSFYSKTGGPGLTPGIYFRLLMVGSFGPSIRSGESRCG